MSTLVVELLVTISTEEATLLIIETAIMLVIKPVLISPDETIAMLLTQPILPIEIADKVQTARIIRIVPLELHKVQVREAVVIILLLVLIAQVQAVGDLLEEVEAADPLVEAEEVVEANLLITAK